VTESFYTYNLKVLIKFSNIFSKRIKNITANNTKQSETENIWLIVMLNIVHDVRFRFYGKSEIILIYTFQLPLAKFFSQRFV